MTIKLDSRKEFDELLNRVLNPENSIRVTFVNPVSYYSYMGNFDFDYVFSDGFFLTKLNNFFSSKPIERISFDFSSIAGEVFIEAVRQNLKIALVGGTESEVQRTKRTLEARYPGVLIPFATSGFFESEENLSECIKSANADIVIVGMGAPLQEKTIEVLCSLISQPIVYFSCGGFISQTALREDYYFPIVKKLGLMWVQRMIYHKHVRRRLLFDYPKFTVKYILSRFKK